MQSETRHCQNCQQEFVIAPEDFAFYSKIQVPPPTWCPMCRAQRRLIWRNERSVYVRKSDATRKPIFSMFHQTAPVVVYENEYWWSDQWDATDFAQDIDWTRPLLQQFKELASRVPRPARSILSCENSDYSNNASYLKDCYLVFGANYTEKAYYSTYIDKSRECMDSNYMFTCELCYGCFLCTNCYQCLYSVECEQSTELLFCKNVNNSSNCLGCVNLRNAQYCIFNAQYTADAYKKKVAEYHLDTFDGVQKFWQEYKSYLQHFPVKYVHETNTVDATGEYLSQAKSIQNGFWVANSENCKYSQMLIIPTTKDSYDYSTWGNNAELIYECSQVGVNISSLRFCYDIFPNSSDCEYSMHCTSSSDLFLCAGLKKKQYCILNKQYTKEEYEELVPKLREHMSQMPYVDKQGRSYPYGEFFPYDFVPYGYNESIAYELLPLSKKEAHAKGFTWRDPDEKSYNITMQASTVPGSIHKTTDTVLDEVIGCADEGKCPHNCTRAFKIISKELEFYRRLQIPLPRLCPNCRHHDRLQWRNGLELYESTCSCGGATSRDGQYRNNVDHDHRSAPCTQRFQTAYAPQNTHIVYCKECYNAEVV